MKRYLGDSVYAEFDGSYLTLTTENGCGPFNEIHLDADVIAALIRFVDHVAAPSTEADR